LLIHATSLANNPDCVLLCVYFKLWASHLVWMANIMDDSSIFDRYQ